MLMHGEVGSIVGGLLLHRNILGISVTDSKKSFSWIEGCVWSPSQVLYHHEMIVISSSDCCNDARNSADHLPSRRSKVSKSEVRALPSLHVIYFGSPLSTRNNGSGGGDYV